MIPSTANYLCYEFITFTIDHSELDMDEQAIDRLIAEKTYSVPIAIVTFGVIVLFLLNTQFYTLNEWYNLNPGVRGIGNFAIPAIVSFLVGLFIVLFRRGGKQTLLGIVLVVAPFILATLFQPVFDGDGQIVRVQFRFQEQLRDWKPESVIPVGADLTTTTPFDYPKFLGPNGNATVDSVVLEKWKLNRPQYVWKQPIGDGWSGFAVVNGNAVTQEQRSDEECVVCYEVETGNVQWSYSVTRRHEDLTGMGKPGPRATPTIHEGNVYAVSATGVLDCLSGNDGTKIWSVDVPEMVGIGQKYSVNSTGNKYSEETSTLAWGRAHSPLIYKDLVIVPGGSLPPTDENFEANQTKAATLLAFDKRTGELAWRGGSRMIAYGSPIVTTLLGQEQIVLVAEDHAVGHHAETGEELWAFARPGQSNMAANCSQVTPISDSQLLFSKGYGLGGELVEVKRDGWSGKYSVESIKKDSRILKTKLTSPVIYEGHLYSLSDGFLECVAIEGLERKWKKRGRFGNGQLLLVGDKLLVHSEVGVLYLLEANPNVYQEIGKIKTIEGVCWNTLSLYKDLLLVRSELEAACIKLPIQAVEKSAAINDAPQRLR